MAYVVQNAALAGAEPIASTSTVQRHALGTLVTAIDPVYGVGEFIYLSGVASTAVGSWVSFLEDDWTTVLLAANAVGRVGVAMSANVASQYGWYQIKGKAVGKALTGFLDDADVYATATDGSVDDAVVVGDLVQGARGAAAVADGLADFEIDRPYVNNGEFFDSTALTATTAELNILAGVTAGTVTASKAVVVDANKDISAFRNVGLVNLDAGSSGVAGTVDIFPTTASKGKLAITAADQTGNTTVTLNANAMGQTTAVNIPDPGAATAYLNTSTTARTAAQGDLNRKYYLEVGVADISVDTSYYINGGDPGTITKVWAIVDGAFITADWTITPKIATVSVTSGLVTVTQAGSAAGTTGNSTPSAANTITAGQGIELLSAGAGAGAQRGRITIEITRT